MTTPDGTILIALSGTDKPGITAEFADILANANVQLLDVEQVTVSGQLTLNFLVRMPDSSDQATVFKDLLWVAREQGVTLDFRLMNSRPEDTYAQSWAITVLSRELGAGVLAQTSRIIKDAGFNIVTINRLSQGSLASIELIVKGPEEANSKALQAQLLAMRETAGCDVAVQPEGLTRRSKRLVVIDMDSTLIQQEVIDEMARLHGVMDKVADITERAMNGEYQFDDALRERVRMLKGAPVSIFEGVLERIDLTPGVEHLVRVLKRLGYRIAVISGGFIEVVEVIQKQLGLDYAFANSLDVRDGKLTGELIGPIVNRQRKADLLESLAQTERIALDQVIAIGDGANDLDMLDRAGLGIAFNAKRIVQEQADYAINQPELSAILYLLGISESEANAVG